VKLPEMVTVPEEIVLETSQEGVPGLGDEIEMKVLPLVKSSNERALETVER